MRSNNSVPSNQPFLVIESFQAFDTLIDQSYELNTSIQPFVRQSEQILIPQFESRVICKERPPEQSPDLFREFNSSSYLRLTNCKNIESEYELQADDLNFLHEYNKNNNFNNSQSDRQISEEDFESIIQLKELHRYYDKFVSFKSGEGIDSGRNYQPQWDILKVHPWASQDIPFEFTNYWQQKTEALGRPLLRVFMRAIQNDPRAFIAYRPSRVYKQRRLKRLGFSLSEFQCIEKRLKTENLVGLQNVKMIIERESLKYDIIKSQWLEFRAEQMKMQQEMEDIQIIQMDEQQWKGSSSNVQDLIQQSDQLQKRLKDCIQEEVRPKLDPIPDLLRNKSEQNQLNQPRWMKYQGCEIEDCQFNPFQNLQSKYLTHQLVEVMDEQYNSMRWQGCQVLWPENPLVLRAPSTLDIEEPSECTLVIRQNDIVGTYMVGQSLVVGSKDLLMVIKRHDHNANENQRYSKRQQRSICLSLIDVTKRRMSCLEGLRVDHDHFLFHRMRYVEMVQIEVDNERKTLQRNRLDLQRRDKMLKLKMLKKRQREEQLKKQKSLLKVKLRWEDLMVRKDNEDPSTKQMYHPPTPVNRGLSKEFNNCEQKVDVKELSTGRDNNVLPHIPIPQNLSALTNRNKIILKRQGIKAPEIPMKITLSYCNTSPSRFRLMVKAESPQTFFYESNSLDTLKNRFQLSGSKVIEEFRHTE